ncbi:MAG: magnesium-translocating P-type ATPase [Burkholderiales bacterium]
MGLNSADHGSAWWLQPLPALVAELGVTDSGLTDDEARARLKRFGLNQFRDRAERSLLSQFLRRFSNPLVLILIAASVVSAFTGEVASFVIIIVIVLLSVTLDFVQEYRAGRAAQRLRQSVELRASVLRNGAAKDVPALQVVPGDVVLLAAGNLVPADGRLLEARDLHMNQALLTGEAFPVEKRAEELADPQADLAGAINALFMGTSVVSGTARLLVCCTGNATAIGEIAHTLNIDPPPTAFELGTRHFGMLIMRLTVLMVLFVLMVNTVTGKPVFESLLFAIALAVGLTPELLPMVVSVTLARGALRMAGKRVIVKRLASIENLGSMDVFCTDKTGTLTEAKIHLERHVDLAGRDRARVLELAYVNSFFETGIKSPLDEAILAQEHIDVSRWKKIGEAPFDFERRRVSVLVDDGATRMLVVKGAPEDILKLSTRYEASDTSVACAWDATAREGAQRLLEELGKEGLRVLGIAYKQVGKAHDHCVVSDETELVFAGFAAFLDPPKESAAKALAALAANGVAVKILTGDNELVTQYICAKLGVAVTGVLTGAEIEQMDDHALQARAGGVNLFCRVNPAQKNRIILALKARGRVVGYLGDGINDAPALHSADVSISVDTAVDVAKAAADLILLEQDLQVLQEGVAEGRRTFANIRKYILMGTSSNFGNMFSMAGASVFLPFLPMLPTQILLNNVLYDLSEIPIPLDHVDSEEIRGPQGWDMRFIRNFMWLIGSVSSLFDFLTFYVLLAMLKADEVLFQTGWFIESLATQVLVIFVIRTRRNPLSSRPHAALAATSLIVLVTALVLPFTVLGRYFGFESPPAKFFAILVILVVAYLCIVEAAKRVFYAHFATQSK